MTNSDTQTLSTESTPAAVTRIGIIGCGVIAQHHARAIIEHLNAQLVALADVNGEAARQLAEQYPEETIAIYDDAHKLLSDDTVDAVILALPTRFRTALGRAVLQAGKHLLTEKPVAMNAGEVEELIAAQDAAPGNLVVASCSSRHTFLPAPTAARKFIQSGDLKTLRELRCRVFVSAKPPTGTMPPAWRLSKAQNGGGILMNWGCYDLDFLLSLADWKLQPQRVLARTFSHPPQYAAQLPPDQDAETHAVASVIFQDGVLLNYERAEYYPGPAEAIWEITGDGGTLRVSMLPNAEPALVFYRATEKEGIEERIFPTAPADWSEVHTGPVHDWINAIRHGHAPMTDLHKALIIACITDAIYQSSDEGRAIEIN